MARIRTVGFELGSATTGVEFIVSGGTPTISTTHPRTGAYELHFDGTLDAISVQAYAAVSDRIGYIQVAFYLGTLPDARLILCKIDVGTEATFYLINTDGAIGAYSITGGVLNELAKSSSIAVGAYHVLEFEHDSINSIGVAKLDGTEFFSGGTTTETWKALNIGPGYQNATMGTPTVFDYYIDSVIINDDTGSFQTSYPGQQSIIHLRPSAAGDNNAWARGGTDSGANWSQEDEVPPNDATDYVASNTLNQIDDYNCAASGLTDEVIDVVQVGFRKARLIGIPAAQFVARVKASSGGTVEESSAITNIATGWHTNASAEPRLYPLTLYDLPGASTTAWTPTDLDAMQVGQRLSTTSSIDVGISAVWAVVSYHAAAAAARQPRPSWAQGSMATGHW